MIVCLWVGKGKGLRKCSCILTWLFVGGEGEEAVQVLLHSCMTIVCWWGGGRG